MRLELNNFGGGVNNWVEPYGIEPTQAVTLHNADVATGAIRPTRGAGALAQAAPLDLTYLTAARSVVRYGDVRYWSDNDTGALSSSLGYFGIAPPATLPVLTLGREGTRFVGEFRYVVTFETNEGWESGPIDLAGGTTTQWATINAALTTSANTANDYPSWSTTHTCSHYGAYGYDVGDRVSYDERAWECTQLWAQWRVLDATVAPPNFLAYWKEITDVVITQTGHDTIAVALPQPTQGAATRINLYRTAANQGTFFLHSTVPAGTQSLTDTKSDLDLAVGRVFTGLSLMPPVYALAGTAWTYVGGKYLTELDGVFYLAYRNRVYLSEQNNPHAWNPLLYVTTESDVTGLAHDNEAVIVLTANRTYRLAGTAVADIALQDLEVVQGCVNWRTVAYLRNAPMWLSNDGLCVYNNVANQEGKYVTVVTEGRYLFAAVPTFGVVANDVYWAFMPDGTAVCFDFRAGLRITTRDAVGAALAYHDQDTDRLLLIDAGGTVTEVGQGDAQTWAYTGPEITGGKVTVLKRWRSLWLHADGDVTVTPTLDGTAYPAIASAGTARRQVRLHGNMLGDRLQLSVTGACTLRGVAMEFTPVGQA